MHPTPPSIEPEGIFDGLRWKAILMGAALDILLTNLAVVPLLFLFAPTTPATSSDPEALGQALEAAAREPAFLLASLAVGLAITIFAGYWAASRAGVHFVRHGGWVAVTSSVLALLLTLLAGGGSGPDPQLGYTALGLAATLPAGILGGWIASKRAPSAGSEGPP